MVIFRLFRVILISIWRWPRPKSQFAESESVQNVQPPFLLPVDRSDQDAYAHFTIQPMQRNLPSETNIELYKMQRRVRKVGKAMFVRSRLRIADPRFRRNKQYLFDTLHMADVRALNSGIFAMLKISNVSGITAGK
jgi:hypothetical protein